MSIKHKQAPLVEKHKQTRSPSFERPAKAYFYATCSLPHQLIGGQKCRLHTDSNASKSKQERRHKSSRAMAKRRQKPVINRQVNNSKSGKRL